MPENILELKNDFDLFIFDIYGVIWDGKATIKNVPEHLSELKNSGKVVILLSNGMERAGDLEKVWFDRGLVKGKHYDKLISSGELAYQFMSEDKRKLRYFVYGKPAPWIFADSSFEEVSDYKKADFVFLGTPKIFNDGKWQDVLELQPFIADLDNFLAEDKVLICANPDLKAVSSHYDEPVIRGGSLAKYYEQEGGEVEYFGKPYPDIYALALEGYEDIDFSRMLMIGDTLETDILGAGSLGIKTALIPTGMSEYYMKEEAQFTDINEYINDLQILPDYKLKEV